MREREREDERYIKKNDRERERIREIYRERHTRIKERKTTRGAIWTCF
jgi:hypothetical protein